MSTTDKLPFLTLSRNIPYLCDFWFCTNDASSSRPGYFVDVEFLHDGIALWCGHIHLVLEFHGIRALRKMLAGAAHV